jgi:dihydroorotase
MGAAATGARHRTAFLNARLLDPESGTDQQGSLLVEDGRIADLGPALFAEGPPPEGVVAIDCGGHCLAPGLVDMRVQLREPGEEHKETIGSGSRAAAAGGVTTMVALPNTEPVIDDGAGVEFVARRARDVKLGKVYTYGAATVGLMGQQLTEFGLLAEYGAVGFTDGIKAIADAQVMRRALSYARTFDKVILQHPEEPSLAGGVMNGGALATRLGLSGIPTQAEVMMIERDLRLVELTGGRYHASHISTAAAVEAIRRAKAGGAAVTCDTAPHYFTLNEDAVGEYRTFAKVSPPLRSEADRLAVLDGVADGTIDAIASDHAPHDQESKRLPFAAAEPGIAGLETLLALSLGLYHAGHIGLLDLLGRLTNGPSKLLGLEAGRIFKGGPADLALFDLQAPSRIEPDDFVSKSKNSPFDGYAVRGKVLKTVVDGRIVFAADA